MDFLFPDPLFHALDVRATEIPLDKEEKNTGGFLIAEFPLTVLDINLYPAH